MHEQSHRLNRGGRIDRTKPLTFQFDGRTYQGYAGDTLASALLANGVHLIGRSFKLHRPRGFVGAGAEEPNAIFELERGEHMEPNLRATEVELYDGLVAASTRGWPGLRFDVSAINDLFSRLFAAGFYYKTFKWPKSLWRYYERAIRRAAGFARAPQHKDPDDYEHRNVHCDILIAGAGPAGLIAALTAVRSGARVVLADDQAEFGGRLLTEPASINGHVASAWIDSVVAELTSHPRLTLLRRATVFGYYDHNFVTVAERCDNHHPPDLRIGPRQRLWRVRAKRVISAQGAFERPLVFCNNDRPGVMLASAVSTYIRRYAVLPGTRAIVFTNNDSAYGAALDLADAGASVVVVDSRHGGAGEIADKVSGADILVLRGYIVCDVVGSRHVRGVHIAKWDGDVMVTVDSTITMDADLVAMSGGWSPAVHLHSQSGGKNRWDEINQCFVPGECAQQNHSAGACNGKFSLVECLQDGVDAASSALTRCGLSPAAVSLPHAKSMGSNALQPLWRVPAQKDPDYCAKQFVDFQNDTSVADIRLAVREGYRNIEHVKRYTALGFGTDQGKLGNINGMAVLAECLQESIPEVGTTTFRPAYTPVTFGTLAGDSTGDLFDPIRTTTIHDWHEEAGAVFEVVGQWHRPRYFPQQGEDMGGAVARECQAARTSLAVMDASTLGKIDVCGPDATTFLERIYTHNVAKMTIGRCAYGVILGEDGMLKDDGVMARVGEQRYYLTTTTGGAADVLAWLELWLQTEWPDLDVYLTSLTDHFSTIAVVGPKSRRVLEKLGCSISLMPDDFPFMTVRNAVLGDIDVQLFRVSFSGELAFEINVNGNHARDMWQRVMDAGGEFNITPYGTETMHVLRAEKGFIIIGQDTDGSVTPVDAGLSWLLSKDKDFLGKRSLSRADSVRSNRKQLVGLLSNDKTTVLGEGAALIDSANAEKPVPIAGHVTSSYWSHTLGYPLALALLVSGRARKGETVLAVQPDGGVVEATVTTPLFFDTKGERQHVR